jgi:lysozyme
MNVGAAGLALIKQFEGCRLTAYQDQRGIWTIGYGHTGPEVIEGLVWSQDQADAALLGDLHTAVSAVMRDVDVAINQNQFDALVSFTYNVGAQAFADSTLLRLLNAGRPYLASAQFPLWSHVNGVEDDGLMRRRDAERALFDTPV